MSNSKKKDRKGQKSDKRTDTGIPEDDEETGVVPPLDLEAAIDVLPFGKRTLDVLCLEFLGEAGQEEDVSHRRR